jgi:hypothetical protein
VLGGVIVLLAAAGLRPVTARGCVLSAPALALLAVGLLAVSDAAPWREQAWASLQLALALPVFVLAARRSGLAGWPAHFLLLAFFGWQGLFHVRHLPLLALVALPTLAASLDGWAMAVAESWGRRHDERAAAPPIGRWLALLLLAGLTAFWFFSRREGFSFLQRNAMLADGVEFQPMPLRRMPDQKLPAPTTLPYHGDFLVEPYPVTAVNFLLAAKLPGPLWNGGNYAGYLIWRLSPERYKVFTDNRYDVFGGRVIRDEHSVLNGWDEAFIASVREHAPEAAARLHTWRQALDHWNVQTLFLPVDAPVNAKLNTVGGWVRVYEDFEWLLWVRDTPQNRPSIERALSLPKPRPWLEAINVRETEGGR